MELSETNFNTLILSITGIITTLITVLIPLVVKNRNFIKKSFNKYKSSLVKSLIIRLQELENKEKNKNDEK